MMVRHLMVNVDQELMDQKSMDQKSMDQDWAANVVLHLMANVDPDQMDQDPMDHVQAANVDLHLMAIVVLHLMANVDQDPMDHVQAANVVHLEAVHLGHHNRSALNEQTQNRSQAIGSTLLPMPSKKFLRNKPSGVNILVCRLSMW